MLDHDHHRLGHPHFNPTDAGVRADERMRTMEGLGGRAPSRRSRLIIGLGFVAAIVGFYVAAAWGWIGVIPN